jgi:hypothetical protein
MVAEDPNTEKRVSRNDWMLVRMPGIVSSASEDLGLFNHKPRRIAGFAESFAALESSLSQRCS